MSLSAVSGLGSIPISKSAGGYGHSLVINASGELYAWGLNDNYQVGDGTNVTRVLPVQIGSGNNWIEVACGDYHSLALNSDGEVYAWGRNIDGQCGISGVASISSPSGVTIPDSTVINKISASSSYSLFADTNNTGKVYGCGSNTYKQLDSTGSQIDSPTHISDFDNATLVSAGPTLAAVAKSNSLVVRGTYDFTPENFNGTTYYNPTSQNASSTVLNSDGVSNYTDLAIGTEFLLAIKENGSLWGYTFKDSNTAPNEDTSIGTHGLFYYTSYPTHNRLVEIDDSEAWTKLECGSDHVLLVDSVGKLYSWGGNSYSQLGRTTSSSYDTNIVQISGYDGVWVNVGCGNYHSLMIFNDE